MTEYIHLIGTEDVRAAGSRMQSAAQDMRSAAGSFEDTLHRQRMFLDDWLNRLENILQEALPK